MPRGRWLPNPVGRARPRFLPRHDGVGDVMATTFCSADTERRVHRVRRLGRRRRGRRPGASLRALRHAMGRSPRATSGRFVDRLPRCNADGSVSMAQAVHDAASRVGGLLVRRWAVMYSGSGTLAATTVVSAGGLAFQRVGGIVRSRVRSAEPSPSMIFGKPKQSMNPVAAASRRPRAMAGVVHEQPRR